MHCLSLFFFVFMCMLAHVRSQFFYKDTGFYAGVIEISGASVDWRDAQEWCENTFGTNLASIHSDTDNDLAVAAIETTWVIDYVTSSWFHIGFNDETTENAFEWTDGSIVDYTNWGTSEPDNSGDYVSIDRSSANNGWYDAASNGLDTNAFTCNTGYITYDNGHFIGVTHILRSYDEILYPIMLEYCENVIGTSLASIHSSAENNYAVDAAQGAQTLAGVSFSTYVFIGLNDIDNEGTYVWTDGSNVDYTNWASGEPDDGGTTVYPEDCTAINTNNAGYTWEDKFRFGSNGATFVCNRPDPTEQPTKEPTKNPTLQPTDALEPVCALVAKWFDGDVELDDLVSGTGTSITVTGDNLNGMTRDQSTGVFYFVGRTHNLWIYDPCNGDAGVTLAGNITGITTGVQGVAFCIDDNTLYLTSVGALFSVDLNTLAATYVGFTGAGAVQGLECDDDGDLYGSAFGTGFIKIDKTDATSTVISASVPNLLYLSFASGNDDVLYGGDYNADILEINKATGAYTVTSLVSDGTTASLTYRGMILLDQDNCDAVTDCPVPPACALVAKSQGEVELDDLVTGTGITITNTNEHFNGMTRDQSSGIFYFGAFSTNNLWKYDPCNGDTSVTLVGTLTGLSGALISVAYCVDDSTLYVVSSVRLYSVDLSSPTLPTTLIGDTGTIAVQGLECDDNGDLYGSGFNTGLIKIDKNDASYTVIGSTVPNLLYLTFDPNNDNIIYGGDYNADIVKINKVTGAYIVTSYIGDGTSAIDGYRGMILLDQDSCNVTIDCPTPSPTLEPSQPTDNPTSQPTNSPTAEPTDSPTNPTFSPTNAPTPFDCPDLCDSEPCQCDEVDGCLWYNFEIGCVQCKSSDGYFRVRANGDDVYNYPCVQCQELFGNECIHCQDNQGCAQCVEGYELTYYDECGLNYCKPIITPDPTPRPTSAPAIDGGFGQCPDLCDPLGDPCDCATEVSNCQVCLSGHGCAQCVSGYFRPSHGGEYNCLHCQDFAGDACLFCQDGYGCGQCESQYTFQEISPCGLRVCVPFN